MDEVALERAVARIAESRQGRFEGVRLEATLERSRTQIEALGASAEALERSLPDRIGEAIRDGLHQEMQTAARNLAEIRGLLNQSLRRLDRIEQELISERNARIDDLEVLVDLVSSGWYGVDERLRRIEEKTQAAAPVVGLLPLAESVEAIAS
jgi:hypothetical protein